MAKQSNLINNKREDGQDLLHKSRLLPFYTIDVSSQDSFEIKKSTFIGKIYRLHDFSDVDKYLAECRLTYPDARHIAYAYIFLAADGQVFQKSSDDKEPSGTAGKPILEVLLREDVRNVLVCVIRYFGGILLGAGGLTRAYGKAATLALNSTRKILKTGHFIYDIEIPYSYIDIFKHFAEKDKLQYEILTYLEKVKIRCFVKTEQEAFFLEKMAEIGNRQFLCTFICEEYAEVSD